MEGADHKVNTQQTVVQKGSLEQQDNLLIQMLESDRIIDIAIFVSILGVAILSLCCYLVEGHLRYHLGVILFLMLGLAISLTIYKCVNSQVKQFTQQQKHHTGDQKDHQTQKSQQQSGNLTKRQEKPQKKALLKEQ